MIVDVIWGVLALYGIVALGADVTRYVAYRRSRAPRRPHRGNPDGRRL